MTDRNPSLETNPDLVVVGAGLAGLTCAQQVQQAGYRVLVLEKARGVGGRATTRRLDTTCVDRGLPFLAVQGDRTAQLAASLQDRQVLQPWPPQALQATASSWTERPLPPSYAAPAGISAIAQDLAQDLPVRCHYRVQQCRPQGDGWQVQPASSTAASITSRALVLAIPAPQAQALLEPLEAAALPHLASARHCLATVEFAPCLAVAAGYPAGTLAAWPGPWLEFPGDRHLARLSLESSKRSATEAVLVAYSTPEFAQAQLEALDLEPAARQLLQQLAARLPLPASPSWMLPHRWRYAVVTRPAQQPYLTVSTSPLLLCCGDWCLGDRLEEALESGAAAATAVLAYLSAQPA